MPMEIEVRFRIPNELAHKRLLEDPLVTRLQMRDFKEAGMVAEYYDTPTHALKAIRCTLRRRLENGQPHVSFKSSAELVSHKLLARQKWECAAEDISMAIGILSDMGAPPQLAELAGTEGFLARGRFEYIRRGVPLMLPENTAVELDVDQGRILVDDKEEKMLELVLKLLYGDPQHLEELAEALEQAFDLPRELSSKYERLLRLLRSRR